MLNITLRTKELLRALRIVVNAIDEDKQDTNSGVFIETKENKLELKGVGYNLFVKCDCNAKINEDGKISIKYKLIEEFLRKIEDEYISIIEKDNYIDILASSVSTRFNLIKYEKPSEINIISGVEYTFDKKILLENIEKTQFAASNDVSRGVFNCIKFDVEQNILKLVATDSFRMLYKTMPIQINKTDENISLNIPLKVTQSILKIFKESEKNELLFKSEGSKVLFKLDDIEVLAKVVEVKFPDYQNVLSLIKSNHIIKVKKSEFQKKLELVQLFVKDKKERKDVAQFSFDKNELTISGFNDLANIEQKLIITTDSEDISTIYLNIKYLIEYLNTVDKDAILSIDMNGPTSAVIIKDNINVDNLYLMMPIKTKA